MVNERSCPENKGNKLMYLRHLHITNFKNYTEVAPDFSEKINCFTGDNGTGKTNLLDAIHYLSFCKSYFNHVDIQNIKHGERFFAIHGKFIRNGDQSDKVSCIQKAGERKQFRLNDKQYDRLADHIGAFPLVMISPYDRDLINEGSEIRRRMIDSVISQFDKVYLDDLINYNKALQQRNTLLKQFYERNYFDPSMLDVWDEQISRLGTEIFNKREDFVRRFIPIFQKYFDFISEGKESVSIQYDSQLHDATPQELLTASLEKDRILKYTTTGIHKDDLIFRIFDYPVKKFGSQGQQKSFVIALKLAQFDYTREEKGYKPILLFDDIFDKLDDHRVKQLIKLVSENNFGQVFITDTQRQRIERIFKMVNIDHRIFNVSGGKLSEEDI
ncbi:MAG: DNA replication/repair protein RecF [Bacteroidales bacterium]|nr:DNA replication/repair protein RecF [Bacteroidales bacterium]